MGGERARNLPRHHLCGRRPWQVPSQHTYGGVLIPGDGEGWCRMESHPRQPTLTLKHLLP